MLESGAAVDEDVAAAFAKAKKASSYGREAGDGDGKGASDDGVDFVGFLEFIHCLDIEVRVIWGLAGGSTAALRLLIRAQGEVELVVLLLLVHLGAGKLGPAANLLMKAGSHGTRIHGAIPLIPRNKLPLLQFACFWLDISRMYRQRGSMR